MAGTMIQIESRDGPSFQAYLSLPKPAQRTAAVVIASSIHGIDVDHQAIADVLADNGYIAVAPDLFWRTVPGPLHRDDQRSRVRSQPRDEKIRTGEADIADTISYLKTLDQFDGRAVTMGFCYGGPFAILGPKRLGCVAGISCHGSVMGAYAHELEGVTKPVAIIWGDNDHSAPAEVLDIYRARAAAMPNLQHHVLPGIQHGFMLRGNTKHFDKGAYEFAMNKSLELLKELPAP